MKSFLVAFLLLFCLTLVELKSPFKSSKLTALPASVEGVPPGFKTAVSQNGLTYFSNVGLEILQKILATLVIPDLSGEADTAIGRVDWWLTELKLASFGIGAHQIKIVPGSGVNVAIANVEVHLTLDWKYREKSWPHISDHGSADISVTGASSQVGLAVTDVNSRPHVTVTSDGFNIGDLQIKLHGGASWLYNFFISILKHYIEDAINKAVTKAIVENVDNGVNKALSTLPISIPINHQVEIDFPLVDNPIFNPSYITIPQLGEFYQISQHNECPSPRAPLPDEVTGQMVNMMLGDFVANSAGFTFFNLGELKLIISEKDIPPWSPVQLNTTSWQYILPPLYNKYPNQLMQLKIYSTKPPTAVFTPSGATVSAIGNCDVYVINPDQSTTLAFTLGGYAATLGEAYLQGTTICGNLTYASADFNVTYSSIGPFDVKNLDKLINLFLSQGLIPAINQVLHTGFPLPVIAGLSFNNPSVGWGNGYLYIATDITYNPPEAQGL